MSQPDDDLMVATCPFCDVQVVSPVLRPEELLRIHWERTCTTATDDTVIDLRSADAGADDAARVDIDGLDGLILEELDRDGFDAVTDRRGPSGPDGDPDGELDGELRAKVTAEIEALQTQLRFLDLWERVEPMSRDELQDEALRILVMIMELGRRLD